MAATTGPGPDVPRPPAIDDLVRAVRAARASTLALVADLDDDRLLGPQLEIVNPLLWEIGHVAWFQERWVLRHLAGRPPLLAEADRLWDSAAVAHDSRWHLPLPERAATVAYLEAVRDRVVDHLEAARPRGLATAELHLVLLALDHEGMHCEAFTYTRQTHGWPAPALPDGSQPGAPVSSAAGPLAGDVEVPGGLFFLGSPGAYPYTLDNEQWEHPVAIAPFRIARAPVTQAELAEFVADGGYEREELWRSEGWRWRVAAGADRPLDWRRAADGAWQRRVFDRWLALEPHGPAVHVSWHEADAYCRWSGRRLPTEAEWEAAAAGAADGEGRGLAASLGGRKRYYPWGSGEPAAERANLDGRLGGTLDVGALPAGDSAFGCRQMLGNVWEWTASDFLPYPGFSPGPYREYSEPWFGDRKVLRGGSWATPGRLLRNTWRNYFTPERRDLFAGFRTCAR
ncbi:MAG TPA: selenoneine synthase SenA [Thermoanaerobaculia bacterium]|nr:selenoneine synthase SenA [Thermoanaerobaculia bacterium]